MQTDAGDAPTAPKVRLSHTQLWSFQKGFYEQEGTDAWARKIPFFPTSNVFIAHAYANILIRFMQDWMKQGVPDDQPFYILELGAGTGMFGFYLLSQLLDLRERLGLPGRLFVYVMSDFVAQNVRFWREHPALEGFVADGAIRFARFEAGASDRIEIESPDGADWQAIDARNPASKPLIVIANYLFDSLPCDLFRIAEHRLQEGLARPNIRPNRNVDINLGAIMDEAGFDFTYQEVGTPYYGDPLYDTILAGYRDAFPEAHFLFPVGSLDCIRSLLPCSQGNMLLIATDKAYAELYELYMTQSPDIVLHNEAFSVTVNFHAVGEYARLCGGSHHHQRTPGTDHYLRLHLRIRPRQSARDAKRGCLLHRRDRSRAPIQCLQPLRA